MSNENDDATQLGSIGRHMSKPQQTGNPQARPAFQAPSLPAHPQEQDGDEEGTVLSVHNANHYATHTFDATMKAPCSAHTMQRPTGLQGLRFQRRSPCRRNRRTAACRRNSRCHNRSQFRQRHHANAHKPRHRSPSQRSRPDQP